MRAAALFLFPGILVYDSAPALMADHVMAFWVPPLALALLRFRRWFTPRELDEWIRKGKIRDGKTMIGFLRWKRYGASK